ncbi:MAG: hypothetical protein WCE75_04640 [Terracidiphilus sp.]
MFRRSASAATNSLKARPYGRAGGIDDRWPLEETCNGSPRTVDCQPLRTVDCQPLRAVGCHCHRAVGCHCHRAAGCQPPRTVDCHCRVPWTASRSAP